MINEKLLLFLKNNGKYRSMGREMFLIELLGESFIICSWRIIILAKIWFLS